MTRGAMGSSEHARSYTSFAFWLSIKQSVDKRDRVAAPAVEAVVVVIVAVVGGIAVLERCVEG